MHFLVEMILFILKIMWLWLVAIYKAIVPATFQGFKDVKGQIVLITGAGSGLGRLMSLQFAERGCHLVLWDINEAGNEETAELVKAKGSLVHTYTVDLANREKIYEAADKVKADVGDVDILVNNAGIVTGRKFLDCPDQLIEKTMEVNCNAHFWTVKSFLPAMLSKNKGHIVSIASSAGLFGVAGLADYCASKFGAVGFNESLRQELLKSGKTGVHTTVVCPFFINTGMFDGVKVRFPGFLNILDPHDVIQRIMNAILTNQECLMIPRSVYSTFYFKGLFPVNVGDHLAQFLGISSSMDEYIGRSKQE